jgi:hypothetical protein
MGKAQAQGVPPSSQMGRVEARGQHHLGVEGAQMPGELRRLVDVAAGTFVDPTRHEGVGMLEGWQVPLAIRLAAGRIEGVQIQAGQASQSVVDRHAVGRGDVGDDG